MSGIFNKDEIDVSKLEGLTFHTKRIGLEECILPKTVYEHIIFKDHLSAARFIVDQINEKYNTCFGVQYTSMLDFFTEGWACWELCNYEKEWASMGWQVDIVKE